MVATERLRGNDPVIETASWDVDGTLYRMRPMLRRLGAAWLAETVRGRGIRAWREMATLRRRRRAAHRIRASGGTPDDASELIPSAEVLALERRWYASAIGAAGPRPGVVAVLDHLAAAGVRQVVLSDHASEAKLEALGLAGRFERVWAGDALGLLKPAPALFERVIGELGGAAERHLHLGDRLDSDAPAAASVGFHVAILRSGRVRGVIPPRTRVFPDAGALLAALRDGWPG